MRGEDEMTRGELIDWLREGIRGRVQRYGCVELSDELVCEAFDDSIEAFDRFLIEEGLCAGRDDRLWVWQLAHAGER